MHKISRIVALFYFSIFISLSSFSQNSDTTTTEDEFKEWNNSPYDEFNGIKENNNEEFEEWTDTIKEEFNETTGSEELNKESSSDKGENCEKNCKEQKNIKNSVKWVIISLFFTILAGFLVRNKNTRNLRGLFLVSAIIVYGFYKGACPCPIMSFQNLLLFFLGQDVHWTKYLWFLALLPITYVFGKVWCGWICHLGALQELFFHPGKIKILQSTKSQDILRFVRMFFLLILLSQLIITKTNLFKEIDPFKVAFNLYSNNIIGWVLLGLVVISSLFIYRPFCKAICPIGLILGWITKIPRSSLIGINGNCISCTSCNNVCKINAITRNEKISLIDNQECIACGDCLDSCKQTGLTFVRKNSSHNDKVICKN
jgi:ferredoxin